MAISIIQGLVITVAILVVYNWQSKGGSEIETRTMVFTTLVFFFVLLSLVNRSFYYSVFTSLKNKNNMMVFVNTITLLMLGMIIYISPIASFFEVQH
jgi:Ca2+-transporting ATPase